VGLLSSTCRWGWPGANRMSNLELGLPTFLQLTHTPGGPSGLASQIIYVTGSWGSAGSIGKRRAFFAKKCAGCHGMSNSHS